MGENWWRPVFLMTKKNREKIMKNWKNSWENRMFYYKNRWCKKIRPDNLSYLFKCPDDLVALSGMKRTRVPFESAFALSREEDKVKAIPGWDVESPTSSYSRFSQAARLMKVLGKPRGRGQRTSSSPTLASAHNLLCAQKSPWQSIPEKHTQAYL